MKSKPKIEGLVVLALLLIALPLTLAQQGENKIDKNGTIESELIDSELAPLEEDQNETVSESQIVLSKIGLFFTFNKEKKAEKQLALAKLELIKAKIALKNNNTKAMEQALEKHDQLIEKVKKSVETKEEATLSDINKSANWVIGLERAIEVHEIKIDRLNALISNNSNLSEKQIAKIQARIEKSRESVQHLKQVESTKEERIKIKLMAVGNMSEDQADKELKNIRESKDLSKVREHTNNTNKVNGKVKI